MKEFVKLKARQSSKISCKLKLRVLKNSIKFIDSNCCLPETPSLHTANLIYQKGERFFFQALLINV